MKRHLRLLAGAELDWTHCGRWVLKKLIVVSIRDATCLTCRRLVLGVADYHLPEADD